MEDKTWVYETKTGDLQKCEIIKFFFQFNFGDLDFFSIIIF